MNIFFYEISINILLKFIKFIINLKYLTFILQKFSKFKFFEKIILHKN